MNVNFFLSQTVLVCVWNYLSCRSVLTENAEYFNSSALKINNGNWTTTEQKTENIQAVKQASASAHVSKVNIK